MWEKTRYNFNCCVVCVYVRIHFVSNYFLDDGNGHNMLANRNWKWIWQKRNNHIHTRMQLRFALCLMFRVWVQTMLSKRDNTAQSVKNKMRKNDFELLFVSLTAQLRHRRTNTKYRFIITHHTIERMFIHFHKSTCSKVHTHTFSRCTKDPLWQHNQQDNWEPFIIHTLQTTWLHSHTMRGNGQAMGGESRTNVESFSGCRTHLSLLLCGILQQQSTDLIKSF